MGMSRKKRLQIIADNMDAGIGPRVVGGVYRSGYWGITYEVTAVQRNMDTYYWSVTERDLDGPYPGRVRNHCTAWDTRRDTVITTPQEVAA